MINSRHILNLSIELIIKPQALDTLAPGWGEFQDFQKKSLKKFLKSFKKV
jgi:hypothetical protein